MAIFTITGPYLPCLLPLLPFRPKQLDFFCGKLANALAVILAVNMLPLDKKRKTAMLLLCAIEFANSVFYMQFNPMITAIIIISFMLVEKGKEQWATLLIVAGLY